MDLTTAEAAKKLGVTPRRVLQLIRTGRLPAQRFGPTYMIDPKDLALVKNRKPGRPRTPKKSRLGRKERL